MAYLFSEPVGELMKENLGAIDHLIRATADLALMVDRDGRIHEVYFGGDFGAEEGAEWQGRAVSDVVTDATRPKVQRLLDEVGREGVSSFRQVNHVLPSGREVPIGYTAVRLGGGDRFMLVGKDLQALAELQERLVRAQQAMERDYWKLRNVETRYRLLFQRSAEPVLILDSDTFRIEDANPAAARAFDVDAAKLVDGGGDSVLEHVDDDSREPLEDYLKGARDRGGNAEFEVSVGGETWWFRASPVPADPPMLIVHLRGEGEQVVPGVGADGLAPDPTAVLQQLPDGCVVIDEDGVVRASNSAFRSLIEVPGEDEVVGRSFEEWLGRPGADLTVLVNTVREHGVVRLFSTTLIGDLGGRTEVELSAVGLSNGTPGVVILARDVGRRLDPTSAGASRNLSRAVEQLTQLVGKTSLKALVQDTVEMVEQHFIEAALELTGGNRTATAELLGVSRQNLYTKLHRYGLTDE